MKHRKSRKTRERPVRQMRLPANLKIHGRDYAVHKEQDEFLLFDAIGNLVGRNKNIDALLVNFV